MKRQISFGSIEQFRNTITNIGHRARFSGVDTTGNNIYDEDIKLPTVVAIGSEKIHGTNASICFSNSTGLWIQSKNSIITPENDNFGCAKWATERSDIWKNLIIKLANAHNVDLDTQIISVFFEWCGGSVQKKSAVTGLDKLAIIFQHYKVSTLDPTSDIDSFWNKAVVESNYVSDNDSGIYNIMDFPNYEFKIDFEKPSVLQNKFIEQVMSIEANSPVGQAFGIDGNIGEGIVCTFMYKNKLFRFKVKGEKHAGGCKVKTLTPVDLEQEQKIIEFANYACSQSRLDQAWQEIFNIGSSNPVIPTIKYTGNFIKAVITDVIKEESDIIKDRELDPKSINGTISKISRVWFMERLNKEVGI